MSNDLPKGKPILCVDFDGVLHSYTSGWKGPRVIPDPPVDGAIQFLIEAQKHFEVCIYSSRSRYFGGRRAMKKWLYWQYIDLCIELENKDREIKVMFIDEARREAKKFISELSFPLMKPAAFLQIDDRAITFNGIFPSVEEIKVFRPWNKRSDGIPVPDVLSVCPDERIDESLHKTQIPHWHMKIKKMVSDNIRFPRWYLPVSFSIETHSWVCYPIFIAPVVLVWSLISSCFRNLWFDALQISRKWNSIVQEKTSDRFPPRNKRKAVAEISLASCFPGGPREWEAAIQAGIDFWMRSAGHYPTGDRRFVIELFNIMLEKAQKNNRFIYARAAKKLKAGQMVVESSREKPEWM